MDKMEAVNHSAWINTVLNYVLGDKIKVLAQKSRHVEIMLF